MVLFLLILFFVATVTLSLMNRKEYALCILGVVSLLVFNQHVKYNIPLFPNLNFFNDVLIALALTSMFLAFKKWKFSLTDLLVITLFGIICISQYYSPYSVITTNIAGKEFIRIILCYSIFKLLLSNPKYQIFFLKLMVCFTAVVVILGVYEMRMGVSLYDVLSESLKQGIRRVAPSYRLGFRRMSGPYGEPISAGVMLGIAFMISHALSKAKLWKKSGLLMGAIPLKRSTCLYIILGIGALMPMSRGPALSLILTFILFSVLVVGFKSLRGVIISLLGFSIFLTFTAMYFDSVLTPTKINQTQITSSNKARYKKFQEILPVIRENLLLGRGSNPDLVREEAPFDSHYLGLTSKSGIFATIVFCLIGFTQFVRLVKRGNKCYANNRIDGLFSYGFATIIFFVYFNFLSWSLLGTLSSVLYGFFGLFEAHLISKAGYLDEWVASRKRVPKKMVNVHSMSN